MSTTSIITIHSSINVLPFPGAIALSLDAQYLLVAHYCNVSTTTPQTSPPCTNAMTSIDLTNGTRNRFSPWPALRWAWRSSEPARLWSSRPLIFCSSTPPPAHNWWKRSRMSLRRFPCRWRPFRARLCRPRLPHPPTAVRSGASPAQAPQLSSYSSIPVHTNGISATFYQLALAAAADQFVG